MKGCHLLLVCAFATSHASAASSDAPAQPSHFSLAMNSARASAVDFSAQTTLIGSGLRGTEISQANLADFSGDVFNNMRATSAFVQKQAAKAGTRDGWLVALAAFGLVVLQLRRKHKSLPQRRIAPHA
jgi:hypothetical protein